MCIYDYKYSSFQIYHCVFYLSSTRFSLTDRFIYQLNSLIYYFPIKWKQHKHLDNSNQKCRRIVNMKLTRCRASHKSCCVCLLVGICVAYVGILLFPNQLENACDILCL